MRRSRIATPMVPGQRGAPSGVARAFTRRVVAAVVLAPRRAWLAGAIAIVIALTAYNIAHTNMVFGGTRYFWLDDDQMISMRYARNLAEGLGLVWNPGERVEGYTNFGWTLVMAAVHAFGASDAAAPLVVKVVNLVLAGGVVVVSERLLTLMAPRRGLARPVALLTLALSLDLVFWSANGFETTAVTLAFLIALEGVLTRARNHEQPLGGRAAVAFAAILLIRGDGLHVWAGAALVACALSRARLRTIVLLGLTLLPAAAHLAWRRTYYGDFLPNTYYLKIVGLDNVASRAFVYTARFATSYAVALFAAVAGAFLPRATQRNVLVIGLLPTAIYVFRVGGDLFVHARYFAHLVPVILVVGVASIDAIRGANLVARSFGHVALFLSTVLASGVHGVRSLHETVAVNGNSRSEMAIGVYLHEHALKTSSIAVLAAGVVPYVSRLRAYDVLGKTDAVIARLQPYPGAPIGHGKLNPEYTLGKGPDFIDFGVSAVAANLADLTSRVDPSRRLNEYGLYVVRSPTFLRDYRENVVTVPGTGGASSFFVRESSVERERLGAVKTSPIRADAMTP